MNWEDRRMQLILDVAFVFAITFVVLRWLILIYYAIIRPQPLVGDEFHFLNYLTFLRENDIADSLTKSVAINYTILALPFSIVLDEIVSLRLVNLLLLCLFIYFLFKKKFPNSKYVLLIALFYTGKVGIFNVGINDALFAVSFAFILIECICIMKDSKSEHPNLLLVSVALLLTTRPLVLIYLPLFVTILFIIWKYNILKDVKFITIIVTAIIMLFHVPSLINNQTPCWDNKTTESEMTWAQRQYLAQIEVNKGLRPEGTHPSWEELRLYINQNGENSLPKTFVESIYFDWNLTFYEFFKDLYFSFKGLLLQSGTLVFIFIFCLYFGLVNRIKTLIYCSLPLTYALLVFSFIIISNVEWRWYAPVVLSFIPFIGLVFDFMKFNILSMFKLSLSLSTLILSAIGVYNLLN